MEKTRDQQNAAGSKPQLVEQVNDCLRSGDYSRALDLLRGIDSEFPNDVELSDLEKRAHDGVQRKAEADRLITESQELFAQRKSAEAIHLLRKAYELDKTNSLARAILSNALVEHAQSVVDTDWLKAETLTNQALALNPAHPTAKAVLNLIVDRKQTSSVEDWVTQARKLQSSGDLFGALAWVAEGLAVHPHDPKLLQIQDAVQRDQDARRRQARRGDLDELRRLQREIDGATDVAAKQALATRIQSVAAKHWTDGEILSIANALLLRLGLVSQETSSASLRNKNATLILHVPRPNAPKPPNVDTNSIPLSPAEPSPIAPNQLALNQVVPNQDSPAPVAPTQILPDQAPPIPVLPSPAAPTSVPSEKVSATAPPGRVSPSKTLLRPPLRGKPRPALPKPSVPAPQAAVPAAEPPAAAATAKSTSSQPKQPAKSNSGMLLLIASAAAISLVAAIFFYAQKHPAPSAAKAPAVARAVSEPAPSAPTASAPDASAVGTSVPAPTTPEISQPASVASSDSAASKATTVVSPGAPADVQPTAASAPNVGALVVVAGQDGAQVTLNGKLLRQLTQAGQLLIPNLPPKDYVVQVSKPGFQNPQQQTIRIRKGEQAKLIFNLQPPQPTLASLAIQGGSPGTAVFVDQTPVGTIQPDGTLAVSSVNPGDHTVELRKDRFKPRQLKKHFVAGGTISLAAADAALEAAPGVLKITFAPADAKVAVVKGDQLTVVNNGTPLTLAAGTYTLTARTADRFTRSSTFEVVAGQSKNLDLFLAPNGMSKWEDPGAWKQEKDSFSRKGGDFVLYGAVPTSGTFIFSAMIAKGHVLQWVCNYTDPRNYILFQLDENYFYRAVIRNGQKTDEIKVADKGDKKSFRSLHIRVSPVEIVHQVRHGDSWTVVDRWTQSGSNLSSGKFGFYIPGDDQVALSSFAHYADLNIR